jgi:hypothetical protein
MSAKAVFIEKVPFVFRRKGRGRSSSRRRLFGGDWEDRVLEARGRGRKDASRHTLCGRLAIHGSAASNREDKSHDGNTEAHALADRDSIEGILQVNASVNYR